MSLIGRYGNDTAVCIDQVCSHVIIDPIISVVVYDAVGPSEAVKKLAKIADAGLGSYIFYEIMGFFVGAPHRWRDDSNSFTRSEALRILN